MRLTYAVGRSARRERDAATLILAGVTVTAFFTAWQTFVQQQNAATLQEVYSWILGNIPSSGWADVVLILPYVAVAAVVIIALRRVVDVRTSATTRRRASGFDVSARAIIGDRRQLVRPPAVAVTGLIACRDHVARASASSRAWLRCDPLSAIVGPFPRVAT